MLCVLFFILLCVVVLCASSVFVARRTLGTRLACSLCFDGFCFLLFIVCCLCCL